MADDNMAIGEDITKIAENVIAGIENYLIKAFGFPKSVLVIFSKAAFSRPPQPVVSHTAFFELTWNFLNHVQDILNTATPVSSEVTVYGDSQSSWNVATQTDDNNRKRNEEVVQITASTEEINRRIQAFIQRKQAEVDSYNKREFCVLPDDPQVYRVCNKVESSRKGLSDDGKRKLKSIPGDIWTPSHPSTALALKHIPPAMLERLGNVENHVLSKKDKSHQDVFSMSSIMVDASKNCNQCNGGFPMTLRCSPSCRQGHSNTFKDACERIGKLEDRILYLEGLSPEYFKPTRSSIHDLKHRHSPYTLNERLSSRKGETDTSAIDRRIEKLKFILASRIKGSKPS